MDLDPTTAALWARHRARYKVGKVYREPCDNCGLVDFVAPWTWPEATPKLPALSLCLDCIDYAHEWESMIQRAHTRPLIYPTCPVIAETNASALLPPPSPVRCRCHRDDPEGFFVDELDNERLAVLQYCTRCQSTWVHHAERCKVVATSHALASLVC